MKILALGFSFLVLGLLSDPQLNGSPLFALEQITVSYQGPGILTPAFCSCHAAGFFPGAEPGRQADTYQIRRGPYRPGYRLAPISLCGELERFEGP